MDFGAEFLIFLAEFRELGLDGVKLGGDGHYARDGGAENGDDGPLAYRYGLEGVRGEVLNQDGV